MLDAQAIARLRSHPRALRAARAPNPDAEALGPLGALPGLWRSLPGRGWNLIALPFAGATNADGRDFRLLMNQFDETLDFQLVDTGVPNRGIAGAPPQEADQILAALNYLQKVTQLVAEDEPVSGDAGAPDTPIHQEPGLWLHMINQTTDRLDIARLATIPHGDAVLALGTSREAPGGPEIPALSGLPVGGPTDLDDPYLQPYKHFHDAPFRGLFDPTQANALLRAANAGVDFVRTVTLEVTTTAASGGIHNIPFVVKQANAVEMQSTFWLSTTRKADGSLGKRLQYSQLVMLDFAGLKWPHISIDTLVPDTEDGEDASEG